MRTPGDPVENLFPAVEPPGVARIALVGGAPGRDEDFYGLPFAGSAGALLDGALERCGMTRSQMFCGNLCQRRASETDDFNRLNWNEPCVQLGLTQLALDLEKFRPSIVVCLGPEALHLFKNGNIAPPRSKGCHNWPDKIGNWRGSLFGSGFLSGSDVAPTGQSSPEKEFSDSSAVKYATVLPRTPSNGQVGGSNPSPGPLKCIAAYHPFFVSRDYSQQAYYRCAPGIGDFERLRLEAASTALDLPVRHISVLKREGLPGVAFEGVLKRLERMRQDKLPVAVDIEGSTDTGVTSIAFSRNKETATVIPFARLSFARIWSKEDEGVIWQAVKALLEDPAIIKIFHHAAYDCFVLEWLLGIVTVNVQDTIEQWWELFAELKKSLATLVSLLTRQPFYKPDREDGVMKFSSDEELWNYNGFDSACTMECWKRMWNLLERGRHLPVPKLQTLPDAAGPDQAGSR